MEAATKPFLEYGVIGALCVLLLIAVRHLYLEYKKNSETWKQVALKSQDNFIEISKKQNETNQKLIEIRERDADQNKNFHVAIGKRLDEMPERIVKEFEYRKVHEPKSKEQT